LWADRLWLAIARTKRHDIDLTALDLGKYSLLTSYDRGQAYAAAVSHFKDLPDEQRIARMESLIAMLMPDGVGDAGPFKLLSWDEARALQADGTVSLYPHSVSHPILARCTDEKVHREISGSCAAVEREIGVAPTIFSYPNGRKEDFDERAKAVLRRRGVRWAVSTTEGFAHQGSDPLELPRIPVGSDLSFARFCLIMSGVLPRRLRYVTQYPRDGASARRLGPTERTRLPQDFLSTTR